MSAPILQVENLGVSFHTRHGEVRAVDGISFDLEPGQKIGIVGESGSGKSVSCMSLLGLIPKPPGRIESGTARFDGQDLLQLSEKQLRTIRGKRIGMIFQDPMTSLNPWMKVSNQIMEPLIVHEGMGKKEAAKRAITALEEVGINDAEARMKSYPHEFSGGMRQRVMIAMTLITRPEILIADEPTTALDVTVQKQVLDLLEERQRDLGSAIILISHDLAVVSTFCDEVNVMYAGRIVERAPARAIFENPAHAYTEALLRSIPANHARDEVLYTIPGSPPDLRGGVEGCAYAPRCEREGTAEHSTTRPAFVEVGPGPDHWAEGCPRCTPTSVLP